jgi:hypothetical protein
MARFWFFNERTRDLVTRALNAIPQGRIIPEEELRLLRAHFDDHYFGELIFLVKEGVLIVPSHMGERPIRAMHGYHPKDRHSYATLMTNRPNLPVQVEKIPEIFQLMSLDAEEAFLRNEKLEAKEIPNQELEVQAI